MNFKKITLLILASILLQIKPFEFESYYLLIKKCDLYIKNKFKVYKKTAIKNYQYQ